MSVSDLVGDIEGVRRRTRLATRGGAIPLAILGLLVLCAAPVYAAASRHNVFFGDNVFGSWSESDAYPHPSVFTRLLLAHPNVNDFHGIGIYWLVAAPVAFAAVAAYYAWRARRTGLSVDGWRVAAFGGGLFAVLVGVLAYTGGPVSSGFDQDGVQPIDVVNPFLVVALCVFALAWVERSVAVLLAGVTFSGLLAVADTISFSNHANVGWERVGAWSWATFILGAVLLLWAGVVALVRRRRA
jgi:hypothetical protein